MAVVSISRIQVRRGRKNQGSGLPQLASGEFGWAIDTQELYIGNGAVSEGAPYVGNTKILTENDNILEFSRGYEYRSSDAFVQTGPSIEFPVTRPILSRLDDRVSVRSFGATGDGTDQTAELQRAIDQHYLNPVLLSDQKARVIIDIEPGIYVISDTIYLPPYVTLRGAGVDKTTIRMIGDGPAFRTVSGLSTIGNYVWNNPQTTFDNQARNIELRDLSILLDTNQGIDVQGCRDSYFKNIKIIGNWENGDLYNQNDYAIRLTSVSSTAASNNNIFDNVQTSNTPFSIYSDYDIVDNIWNNCYFDKHDIGVSFGLNTVLGQINQIEGPCKNTIMNSVFDNISKSAILIKNGFQNRSYQNKFYLVGNRGGTGSDSQYPEWPIIDFVPIGNITENDWFQRTQTMMYDQAYFFNVRYVSEISAPNIVENNFTHVINIGQLGSAGIPYENIIKLPADKPRVFEVDYLYDSITLNSKRTGKLTIIVDPNISYDFDNPNGGSFHITDEYDFIGSNSTAERLDFYCENLDEDGDFVVDTIAISAVNSTLNDNAQLYFRVKTKT